MRGMRACGVPGAALMMDPALPRLTPGTSQHGVVEMRLWFKLLKEMPRRLSDDNEVHWLFSYHDAFIGTEILSVGITPLGKVHAVAPDGTTATSAVGVVTPDGHEREIILTWIGFGTAGQIQCTGMAPIDLGAYGPTLYALPSTFANICFFNGNNMLANNNVFIRKAKLTFLSLADQACVVDWNFTEGGGDRVGAVVSGDPMLSGFDMTLVRRMVPELAQPWPGVDTAANPATALRWVRMTDYRRITREKTAYSRRSSSWLS